ncbi:MAG: hypothetical protein A3C93_02005 [Candidatus Lloydbacteria bacterium RIFCSPHIGHO2_02_FULL_54_17]|uniref:Phosphatidate cytidylyltransferase n=1 Tax=Candidatus Lloydbacteria bacterium RIFCSPHIGHO2_02_FULL_54_17 TaxID=1798664 RepID=A0A1G2DHV5_9BACT|nr:MAG: hypothetical protein A3C93_02005 [Candidatus Lloydbacteria bacterium RIFCSPHIGHO2_02_FULL_54_17]OGZ14884.1 MAG: hypothetical protein A3H76_02610 [Candidatus Lloydbacteria bacterium RIFCSPLOWO2_02_FULL_54_12]OGZ15355.1 MAG: hypothetical protein A2948_00020 [Candidatus Lloydbacteria bacterium RIFCSPLOWO2_01_FULL_54_18]
MYAATVLLLCYSGVFAAAEALFRFGVAREFSRKFAHVFGAGVTMLLPFYGSLLLAGIFGVLFTTVILAARKYGFIQSIREGPTAYGSVLFPIGLTLACVLFWNDPLALLAGIAIFGLADPVAAIVGGSFGKIHYDISGPKTLEGSIAFFAASVTVFLVVMSFARVDFRIFPLIAASAFLALTEGSFGNGKDNLILPAAGAFAASLFL